METDELKAYNNEADECIQRMKEEKKARKHKHYTATVTVNGLKNEIILDNGSPIEKCHRMKQYRSQPKHWK